MSEQPTWRHRQYLALVAEICKPQPSAYSWFTQALELALLWDHITDGDAIDKQQADAALQAALLGWVHNDWYVQNRTSLTPVLMNSLSAWRFGSREKQYDLYTELPCTICMLLRGAAGVGEFMPRVRDQVDQERWEDDRRDNPPFLIVGLPRSRTAWLAAFLTAGDVFCYHELTRRCGHPDEYHELLLETAQPIVGDANPSLPLYYEEIKGNIGHHKLIFIVRDPDEAEAAHKTMLAAAGEEFLPMQAGWSKVAAAFEAMLRAYPAAPRYRYDDLDKQATVRAIAEYCTGRFDAARWALFDELKVTAIPAKVVRNIQGGAS